MARQGPLSGKAGTIITYFRNGKQFVRSMPKSFKQSVATKQRSVEFGTGSKLSKLIRQHCSLTGLSDGSCHTRLTSILTAWYRKVKLENFPAGNVEKLYWFEFNPQKRRSDDVGKTLQFEWKNDELLVTLNNPVAAFKAVSANTFSATLNLHFAAIDVVAGSVAAHATENTDFFISEINDEPMEWRYPFPAAKNMLTIVSYSLQFKDKKGFAVKLRSGYHLPARIVYAHFSGV